MPPAFTPASTSGAELQARAFIAAPNGFVLVDRGGRIVDANLDRLRACRQCIAGYMTKAHVGPRFAKLAKLLTSYEAAIRFP